MTHTLKIKSGFASFGKIKIKPEFMSGMCDMRNKFGKPF